MVAHRRLLRSRPDQRLDALTRMPEGGGGDTLFANMAEAYERLSEPVKALVRTLKAVYDGVLPWKTIYGIDPKPGTAYPRYEHPVVICHPDTGRAVLFVNRGFTTHGIHRHAKRIPPPWLDLVGLHLAAP